MKVGDLTRRIGGGVVGGRLGKDLGRKIGKAAVVGGRGMLLVFEGG